MPWLTNKPLQVSFAYPSNPSKQVLRPSTFLFPAGEITYLVGRSGSGKSTLGNLLVRFYEPSSGEIRLDGNPLDSLDLNWLRNNVTLIQQSSVLFNDSLHQNVAFGGRDPDNVTRKDVQEACGMALLQSTIAGLQHGLDTVIGSGGHSLSGGQKQRLALARAKLRDPPVLILDEVTSGLDPVSRSLIMDAIRLWRKGKTTIIITHDVAQIEEGEYVYVLADGRVVQQGFQKELATMGGGLFAAFLASAGENAGSRRSSGSERGEDGNLSEHMEMRVFESRLSRIMYGLNGGMDPASRLFNRVSLGAATAQATRNRTKQLWDAPSTIDEARTEPRRPRQSLKRQRRDSLEIIKQSSEAIKANRTRGPRDEGLNATHTSSDSMDSIERFAVEHLAQSGRREGQKGKQMPSLAAVFQTVWPTIDKKGRTSLALGLALCVVVAGSNPVFSYIFAKLLEAFWATDDRRGAGAKWAAYLAIIGAIDGIATFFAYLLMEQAGQAWVNTLRGEALSRILSQPKSWFDKAKHSPSRVNECLDRNAEEMRKLVGQFVPIVVIVAGMILTGLIWALAIRWDLTLVALSGVPVVVVMARANSVVSDKWEALCNTAAGDTSSVFTETFSNIRVVRALTLERYFTRKHRRSAEATLRLGMRRAVYAGFFYGLYQSVSYFITALTFYYGTRLLRDGKVNVTDVLRIINLLLFSMGNSILLLGDIPQIAAAKTTAVQMLYYANLPYLHKTHSTKWVPPAAAVGTPFPIQMTNLRFAYPARPTAPVLRNVTLRIDAGTCTAIVGASGCGKSTLAALLLSLYDPSPSPPGLPPPLTFAGSSPLHHHPPGAAYVPQHPFLFPASLSANILYGLPPDSSSDLRDSAARAAGIHDLAASLPSGWDTPLGEGGVALSGGQAQRVGIARALAARPGLLVLDEPTSALDAEAAEGVRGVVAGLVGRDRDRRAGGMAVVVVTHSREMMRVADRIVVLEQGCVVEVGRYDELVARRGVFARLVGGGAWMGQ